MTDSQTSSGESTGPDAGDNSGALVNTPALRAQIAETAQSIARLRNERTTTNAEIQEQLEGLNARGIPKEALKRAIRDAEMDQEQRDTMDLAYVICRAAMGKPVQGDMFAAGDSTTH